MIKIKTKDLTINIINNSIEKDLINNIDDLVDYINTFREIYYNLKS